jgi:hypothetical protein
MSLDPRLLSTPIGAVVGLALTRKTLRPEDRTISNQLIGTGLGTAAGLAIGQLVRGEQLALGSPSERRLRKFYREELPVGEVSDGEVQALNKVIPGGLYGPDRLGYFNFLQRVERNFLTNTARSTHDQHAGHAARVQELKRTIASNTDIPAARKERIQQALEANEKARDAHGWSMVRKGLFGGAARAATETVFTSKGSGR